MTTRPVRKIHISKHNVQRADAFQVPCFDEGFEREVPFAWIDLVRNESRHSIPVARTRLVNFPGIASIHRDPQGDVTAALEAHLDKTAAVGWGSENRGPCFWPVAQRGPPELANVGQLQEGVHTTSGVRWCGELKDYVEDLGGGFVDGTAPLGRARIVLAAPTRTVDKQRCRGGYRFLGLFWALMLA